MNEANFIETIKVTDPNSGCLVDLCLFLHQNGGLFAIDSSYCDQALDNDCIINDPLEECEDENRFAIVKLLGL